MMSDVSGRDLRGSKKRAGVMRLALACTVAVAGWTCTQAVDAQVVKAPRYQGGVDSPTPQLNLPPLPPAITPHGVVVEDVVVRINDQIISRSDVERAQAQLQQEAQQNKMSAGDMVNAQRDLLRDMIDEQLLISKAKEMGLNADADVVRHLDDIRKQNKMDSLDDLEKAVRAQGISYEDFKAQIRNQILKQEVVRDEVGRRLQLTQTEEAKYYNEHLKDFEQPEQIRLSEILVPLPESASAAEIAQAEAKANDLKTKVMQSGSDFAELAKKYSGGPTAAQGGELGLFKRGALAKVLEDQTFGLKVGESTQPIRTRQGFVILKVTEHDAEGPAPMKDVEPQIQEALYMNQMQPALRTYLTKLREDSYVELAPGFVDSGATPNELKPLYTSYAPPPTKKKRVKAKARFDRGTGGRYQTVAAKKGVVASPDSTGTRTLTGADAKAGVDPATGMAVISAPKASSSAVASGKAPAKVKIKREKVRFGQAPRNSLPGGGADDTEDTTVAANTAAPGAVIASNGTAVADNTNAANLADNALNAAAPERKKTRFAGSAKAVKEKKVATVSAKEREKAVATAPPVTTVEKADAKQQAAPLGLSGDTGKKKKKPKRVKGAPKERLAEKAPEPKAAPAPIAPTANPSLAPTDVPAAPATPAPATPPQA